MIDILLASYNGEKYIAEQIESILKQTYKDYRLLIRDDGSTDDTLKIIKKYCSEYPNKIFLIEDEIKCKSAAKNFFQLLQYAESDYIMFSDQDDYWLENKIEVCMNRMTGLEKMDSDKIPILVYANYKVVGENLQDIGFNHNKSQVAKHYIELNRLLVQNYITGCLILANKALYTAMGEYNEAIPMHDGWAAICASAMGIISHIDATVMLYRQHGDNCAGALEVTNMKYRIKRFFDKNTKNANVIYRNQAKLFLDRNRKRLEKKEIQCLEEFISIGFEKKKIIRIIKLLRGNYLKSDFVRKIGQIWFI